MSAWNTGIPSDWLNFKILKTNFNNKVKGPVEPLVVQCIPILISVYKLLRIWIGIFNKVKGPVLCTTVNLKITPCNLFYHLDLMSYY